MPVACSLSGIVLGTRDIPLNESRHGLFSYGVHKSVEEISIRKWCHWMKSSISVQKEKNLGPLSTWPLQAHTASLCKLKKRHAPLGHRNWSPFLWLIQFMPGHSLEKPAYLARGPCGLQPTWPNLTALQKSCYLGPTPWLRYQGKMSQLRTGKRVGSYQAKCTGRARRREQDT